MTHLRGKTSLACAMHSGKEANSALRCQVFFVLIVKCWVVFTENTQNLLRMNLQSLFETFLSSCKLVFVQQMEVLSCKHLQLIHVSAAGLI